MRGVTRLSVFVAGGALAGLALSAVPAAAQSSAAADVCRAFETEAERFACMEGALAAAAAELEAARNRAPAAAPAPMAPAAPAPAAPQADRNRGDLFGLDIPFVGRSNDEELGTEQVARRNPSSNEARAQREREDNDRVQARIVSFREHYPGQLEFNLDNGQIWRQLQGDTVNVRLHENDPMGVEMWRSWAGGYRMRLVEQGLMVRVERIR